MNLYIKTILKWTLIMNLKKINGAIIINNKYGNASSKIEQKILRLIEEFSLLNVEIEVIKNDGNLMYIKSNSLHTKLKPYDFIIYLDKDRYTAKMIESYGFKLFNKSDFIELCDDKMSTHISVSSLGINMPDIVCAPLSFFNESENNDEQFVKEAIEKLSLPIVLKTVYGSLGDGVNKFNSYQEALDGYRKIKGVPCFFQKYINSNNSSIRVLVIDRQIVTAIKRINEVDFRSNCANNKSYSFDFKMPKQMIDDVNKLIKKYDIGYAGIDFIENENGYYFLEMNSNAFFNEAEKVSGKNIAKLYCEYILNEIKK